jgi:drug/metabolite transporter (DMT)-like permease
LSAHGKQRVRGVVALIIASVVWGSTFPIIKIVVKHVNSFRYVWIRNLLAVLAMAPYIAYRLWKGSVAKCSVIGGLLIGSAYTLALWLQGLGTFYTTASNSAFITNLYFIYLHTYEALKRKRYDHRLAVAVIIALAGLYIMTSPTGFGFGEAVVLVGSFIWALQILIVDRYSTTNPLDTTFFMLLPPLTLSILDAMLFEPPTISSLLPVVPHLLYLSLIASIVAYTLQLHGQKYVVASTASTIYLVEPASAPLFAMLIINESVSTAQIAGFALIMLALYLSITSRYSYKLL